MANTSLLRVARAIGGRLATWANAGSVEDAARGLPAEVPGDAAHAATSRAFFAGTDPDV